MAVPLSFDDRDTEIDDTIGNTIFLFYLMQFTISILWIGYYTTTQDSLTSAFGLLSLFSIVQIILLAVSYGLTNIASHFKHILDDISKETSAPTKDIVKQLLFIKTNSSGPTIFQANLPSHSISIKGQEYTLLTEVLSSRYFGLIPMNPRDLTIEHSDISDASFIHGPRHTSKASCEFCPEPSHCRHNILLVENYQSEEPTGAITKPICDSCITIILEHTSNHVMEDYPDHALVSRAI